MELVIRTLVSAALLYAMSRMIDGIEIRGVFSALIAALVLGLVNTVVTLLALPVVVVTLGLALLAVNAVALMITAKLVPGFTVRGFGSALVGAIVLAVLHLLVRVFMGM